ncbi:MAG: Asp-tRNA(Asn)/Glu-tRNA(Gln) amidotransferase subunit GatC [Microgenomates group bacterium]
MKKNKLTKDNILHLAKLSKLKLTNTEIEKYTKQLEETVDYVNNLNQLDTKNVNPTSQTTNLTNVFFEDGEENSQKLTLEEALVNAKNKKNGYFLVKEQFKLVLS